MVEYAYLSMKLSNYYKSKELISTLGGVLCSYKRPILTLGGKRCHIAKQINSTLCSFAHFHTGCSLLLITALNRGVNKSCWQHVTACDIEAVYIKIWFMCGSQDSSIGLLQVHSSTLPCLWAASEDSCLQEGHWLLWMKGSKCEPEERNLHTLMRPCSLFLVFITRQSGKWVCLCMCVCEWKREKKRETETIRVGVCGAYVQCL